MKRQQIDLEYWVGWILFAALVMGAVGILLQLVRYGSLIESGSTGPASSIERSVTEPRAAWQADPADSAVR